MQFFFGSIQIFNYLRMNDAELTSSLWLYAIHGKNAEIIHLLEENQVKPEKEENQKIFYDQIFTESIKCYHIDISNYIQNIYLNSNNACIDGIKYYNFSFIQSDFINKNSFCYLCIYNYYSLVNIILKENSFDINHKMIFTTKI